MAAKAVRKNTELQKVFIQHMIECGIGAKAARMAGIAKGNSNMQAARWMAMDRIRDEIVKGREGLAKTTMFDAANVIRELAVLATTDMSAFIDDKGYLKCSLKDMPPEAIACIKEISDETTTDPATKKTTRRTRVKVYNRINALQLAGKHKAVRAFAEEIEVNSDALSSRLDLILARQKEAISGKQKGNE